MTKADGESRFPHGALETVNSAVGMTPCRTLAPSSALDMARPARLDLGRATPRRQASSPSLSEMRSDLEESTSHVVLVELIGLKQEVAAPKSGPGRGSGGNHRRHLHRRRPLSVEELSRWHCGGHHRGHRYCRRRPKMFASHTFPPPPSWFHDLETRLLVGRR